LCGWRQRGHHDRVVLLAGLEAPHAGSRRSSQGAKSVVLFAPLPPSPNLPIEAVIKFLSAPDMVIVVH
jgi:hypothetical protein